MRKGDSQLGTPYVEYPNTKANIEALTGISEGAIAYATDTNELGSYDGTAWTWGQGSAVVYDTEANILASTENAGVIALASDEFTTDQHHVFFSLGGGAWLRSPFPFILESANPDIGPSQTSSRIGYGTDYISNKVIVNCTIGTNPMTGEGGVWIDNSALPKTMHIYLDGTDKNIMVDFSNDDGYLAHYPFSADEAVRVASGNSVTTGLNGRPMLQDYDRSIGPYPPPKILNGGTY